MLISFSVFRIRKKPIAGWNSGAILLVLYAFINVAFGFFTDDFWNYVFLSVGIFVMLYLFAFFFAPVITGKSYREYGENAMLLVAPVIVYGVLLLILGVFRAFY
jgi:hypothetical protein